MNHLPIFRFIRKRSDWIFVASVFVFVFPISVAPAQTQTQSQIQYSGGWSSTDHQADPIPVQYQQDAHDAKPAGATSSWPEQPISFEAHLQQMQESGGTSSGLESTLETAHTAMGEIRQQAAGWFGSAGKSNKLDLTRMLSSLAIVLGTYFGFVWLVRRFYPAANSQLPSEVVQVLGKTPFGPKQDLQLVRLGSKLVLLLNSPEGTHPIGEITDPAQVEHFASVCQSRRSRLGRAANQSRPTPTVAIPNFQVASGIQPPIGSQAQAPSATGINRGEAGTNPGLASILKSLENVVKQNGGNVFEA